MYRPSSGGVNRNVLSRAERIAILEESQRWTEEQSVFGLPKVRQYVMKRRHAKAAKKEEGAEGVAVEGAAEGAAAPASGAKAPAGKAGAAPAKGAAPGAKGAAPAGKAGAPAGKAAAPSKGAKGK